MIMTSWTEALDAYERSLRHYEATLAGETTDPEPHWSAIELPTEPLPPLLAARATDLVARSRQLSERIQAALHSRAGQPRPGARHTGTRHEPTVSVLDTSA